jgi:ankyrin repeat protein
MVRVLLEGGADVRRYAGNKRTALHHAVNRESLELSRLLLDWGAEVNAENPYKQTPLHYVSILPIAQLLVERGAGVGLKELSGNTPADWARKAGRIAVADWLDSLSRV